MMVRETVACCCVKVEFHKLDWEGALGCIVRCFFVWLGLQSSVGKAENGVVLYLLLEDVCKLVSIHKSIEDVVGQM